MDQSRGNGALPSPRHKRHSIRHIGYADSLELTDNGPDALTRFVEPGSPATDFGGWGEGTGGEKVVYESTDFEGRHPEGRGQHMADAPCCGVEENLH